MTGLFSISFIVALAAARETASPPKVNEKNISSNTDIMSLFPAIADIGYPFPIALPTHVKSGVTSK